jgi:nucleotide-binding universal stress UspA family protein
MFSKVLVAIDNSESTQVVFESALALAKVHQSRLMLLHVMIQQIYFIQIFLTLALLQQ